MGDPQDPNLNVKHLHSKLEAIIARSPIGLAITHGPDFAFESVNENFKRLVGKRDYIGKAWRDVYPELAESSLPQMMKQVFDTGVAVTHVDMALNVRDETGHISEQFYTITYDRITTSDNKPYGVAIHTIRTTDAVRDRKQLADSERRLSAAVATAKVGFYDWSMQANTVYFSEQMKNDWGFAAGGTLEEVLVHIHPDDRQATIEVINQRIADRTHFKTEYRVIRNDGSIVWIEAQGTVTYNADGAPTRFFGTSVNITDRKDADAALRFERNQLRTIFRTSFAAMALWRGPNFIFEQVNPAYQAIFPKRALLGLPLFEAVPELKAQGFPEMLTRVLATGETYVGKEVRAEFRDPVTGETDARYYDFAYVQMRDEKDQPYGVYDLAIDVTDRVIATRALEGAKREAELASQAKSAFLANMSHEIRTPLASIIGYAELLSDLKLSSEDRKEFTDVINRNARSLTRVIDDILDLSKVEAGRLSIELLPMSVSEVVKDAQSLFIERAKSIGIRLRTQIASNVPDVIISDAVRLRQILLNIIGNAVKFTVHGSVDILVTSTELASGAFLFKMTVADTGCGLSEQQSKKLFEPFTQADDTTTREYGGTGLGLVLSRRLAEVLGGTVRIASTELGKGSTFEVTFEARSSGGAVKTEETVIEKNTAQPLVGVSILLVEDSADNQFLIKRLLTRKGATVAVAENGMVGATRALESHFDIVLMDIQMPVMDGYSAMRQLNAAGYQSPVIALTAHAMDEERSRTRSAGFVSHVTKPIEIENLIDHILQALRERREHDAESR